MYYMHIHSVNARLPDEQLRQLAEIRERTGLSTSEVVRVAITHYHRLVAAPARSSLEIMQEAGLVGCVDAEPTLSEAYKAALGEGLDAKHGSR